MNIIELITPQTVVCQAPVASKKHLLELLGELIARSEQGLAARAVVECLLSRERLGSTGLGQGVALPHGRMAAASRARGAFVTIAQGVDFDAIDGQPVQLVFALVVPEHYTDEHLKIISYLAEMFDDREFCRRLRAADSNSALYRLLSQWCSGVP